jgi:hypothetical protein
MRPAFFPSSLASACMSLAISGVRCTSETLRKKGGFFHYRRIRYIQHLFGYPNEKALAIHKSIFAETTSSMVHDNHANRPFCLEDSALNNEQ